MLLAYQSAGHAHADLPAEPRQGWRNLFVDDISDAALADAATAWQSADNYNAMRLGGSPLAAASSAAPPFGRRG